MDCNSYSYAPTMLDGEENYLARYSNDDMEIELVQDGGKCFTVWAYSYDGSMDVYEEFFTRESAERLYMFIRKNYTSAPPGTELMDFISALPNRYGGAVQ